MASEIRVDKINSLSGVGTVTLSPTGVDIAGITTAATLRATTGIVTSLTAGSLTSLGAVSGTTGTFSDAVSGTTGTFTGDVDIAAHIRHTGDTDTKISFDTNIIHFDTANVERLRIKSDGAINLTSENTTGWLLDAGDNSASYSAIDDRFPTTNRTLYLNNETTHRSFVVWNKNGSDGYGFGLDNSGNFKVVYSTNERIRITSDGKLGVGITTPGTLVHQHESSSGANYHKFTNSTTGSEGTDGAYVGLDGNEQFIMWTQETGKIRFGVGDTERAYVNNDGHLGISDGNLVIGTNGHGIDFYNYGTGSNISSNLLDDYETGTFTPAFKAENNSSNATTQVHEAAYTRVGNLVYFRFFITLTSHAAGTTGGSGFVNNLPFTNQNGHSAVHIGYFATWNANQMFVSATVQPSSNSILFRHYTSASSATNNMDYDNNLQPNSKVIMSGCYQAA